MLNYIKMYFLKDTFKTKILFRLFLLDGVGNERNPSSAPRGFVAYEEPEGLHNGGIRVSANCVLNQKHGDGPEKQEQHPDDQKHQSA